MNKIIKFLLSIMIVSLSALFIRSNEKNIGIEINSAAEQMFGYCPEKNLAEEKRKRRNKGTYDHCFTRGFRIREVHNRK